MTRLLLVVAAAAALAHGLTDWWPWALLCATATATAATIPALTVAAHADPRASRWRPTPPIGYCPPRRETRD